jgi:hypothetical protein
MRTPIEILKDLLTQWDKMDGNLTTHYPSGPAPKLMREAHDVIASTKEEPSQTVRQLNNRRRRLLERIQEAKERDMGGLADAVVLCDLQDELQAVESALGWPEPQEPSEASDEPEEVNHAYKVKGHCCPACLCIYDHEDPMQSCQCGGMANDPDMDPVTPGEY